MTKVAGKETKHYYDLKSLYEGEWLNDQKHGFGREILIDGSYYLGRFENGKRNGQGTFFPIKGSK